MSNKILNAVAIPFGYISYYITHHNKNYVVFFDDRQSGLRRVGLSAHLQTALFIVKYHLRATRQVHISLSDVFDTVTPITKYDFSNVDFNRQDDWKYSNSGKRS